jgi:hypothetical protein
VSSGHRQQSFHPWCLQGRGSGLVFGHRSSEPNMVEWFGCVKGCSHFRVKVSEEQRPLRTLNVCQAQGVFRALSVVCPIPGVGRDQGMICPNFQGSAWQRWLEYSECVQRLFLARVSISQWCWAVFGLLLSAGKGLRTPGIFRLVTATCPVPVFL